MERKGKQHIAMFSSCGQSEENISGMTSFREVLEKMLVIVVLPVRNSLRRENELFSSHLVSNTCGLLASIVSELTASALGSEVTSHILMLDNEFLFKIGTHFLFYLFFDIMEINFKIGQQYGCIFFFFKTALHIQLYFLPFLTSFGCFYLLLYPFQCTQNIQ